MSEEKKIESWEIQNFYNSGYIDEENSNEDVKV
jgi:hypothetical protein